MGKIGVGLTLTDSFTAIKKLVFEAKTVSMNRLLEALAKNFEGDELLRR